jgi:outer membrane lipoprotein carrier protein
MRRLYLAASLSILSAQPARAQDITATTIDRAVAAYAKVRTARATFEQTIDNPLTGSAQTSRGEFQQQRPGLLSVRFTDPVGDRIVADGKAIWLYLPSTAPGQVIKMPATKGGAGTVDLTARFLDAPKTRYTISDAGAEVVAGRKARALVLVPRTEQPFAKAKVWIDDEDGAIRQFEVSDANGLVRRVRLTSLRLNVPVDRGAFTFSPPKGVRIYEQPLAP